MKYPLTTHRITSFKNPANGLPFAGKWNFDPKDWDHILGTDSPDADDSLVCTPVKSVGYHCDELFYISTFLQ